MTQTTTEKPHEALAVFLGRWKSEGRSYGTPAQDPENPKAAWEPWQGVEEDIWLPGGSTLERRWDVTTGGRPFKGVAVMGYDEDAGCYVSRSFESHGFFREYRVTRDGDVWRFDGETERATATFSADGRTQMVVWEWRRGKDAPWLPLCERTETRID